MLGATVVLIIIWVMTRVPNPITNGRALSINSMSIVTELFEIAFIIITAIIISKERSKRAPEIKQGQGVPTDNAESAIKEKIWAQHQC
ncbi:MAG: hypothetical protein WCF23_12800 [Candidatus Nitrosopolaris sp.]